ncbi:MAG: hypothetical protein BM564_11330 [Bacteroidetes bacterium MedPE-SWsnd-G2]|mgnify:CR=1 FL=1|nr:MAG: hypothetical protein BM564_11330 [Bacteroidetes bacterium MedPE-SWsnd-G2]
MILKQTFLAQIAVEFVNEFRSILKEKRASSLCQTPSEFDKNYLIIFISPIRDLNSRIGLFYLLTIFKN